MTIRLYEKLFLGVFSTFLLLETAITSGNERSKLPCFFPDMESVKFSTNRTDVYLECKPSYVHAIFVHCGVDEFYSTEREACQPNLNTTSKRRKKRSISEETASSSPKILNYVLLDQDVQLGEFYDARTNKFLSGTSLWSTSALKKIKVENIHIINKQHFDQKAGRTITERLEIMDIKAELKLSFLGGLIEVTGGAGFARQDDLLETDETFTLYYKSRAYSVTIPKATARTYPHECKNKHATHVVNKITYGQNAYFFFKRRLREHEESQAISGNLQVVVKKIPTFKIEGSASIDLEGDLKEIAETSEVKYSGDFKLKSIPTTFENVVEVFKDLPDLVAEGPSFEGAVPTHVQLTPLSEYCDISTILLANIGESAMAQVSKALEEIEFLEIKVNTLRRSNPAMSYPAVKENLRIYKDKLKTYQINFKRKLQTLLPAIRGKQNGKSEENLLGLLTEYNESPFQKVKSSLYLAKREREIKAIIELTKGFDTASQKNFAISDYTNANDVKLFMRHSKVVIFSVNILLTSQVTKLFLKGKTISDSKIWYEDRRSIGLLGKQKRLFKNFALANKNSEFGYFIEITKRNTHPYNISAEHDGISDAAPFIIPDVPVTPKLVSCSHNSFEIEVEKPLYLDAKARGTKKINTWVIKFYVEYWRLSDGQDKGMKKKLYDFSAGTRVVIDSLQPVMSYKFRVVHYTEYGVSSPSAIGETVTTTPCSEPTNLKLDEIEESQMTLSWGKPLVIAPNITISGYKLRLYASSKQISEIQVSHEKEKNAVFKKLDPSTEYEVRVVALSGRFESLPSTLIAYTAPRPPHSLNLVNAGTNSISLSWSPPKLASGESVKEYIVQYSKTNMHGDAAIIGTGKSQTALEETNIKISSLVQGTNYEFSVQVITNRGESKLSSTLIAKTEFKFTDLQKFKDEFNAELQNIQSELRNMSQNFSVRKDGKSAERAGESCKSIKRSFPSSLSGMYWINLKLNVVQVYCDMLSDGGGWLQIGGVTTSEDEYNYYFESNLHTDLQDLSLIPSGNFLLDGTKFTELQSFINFHEFRVYCTKPYHGRVQDATFTDMGSETSKKLFDHVMGSPPTHYTLRLCNALTFLPDDNSMVKTKNCNSLTRRITSQPVDRRLYEYIWGIEEGYYISITSTYRLECDDSYHITPGYKSYGTWKFYVR